MLKHSLRNILMRLESLRKSLQYTLLYNSIFPRAAFFIQSDTLSYHLLNGSFDFWIQFPH